MLVRVGLVEHAVWTLHGHHEIAVEREMLRDGELHHRDLRPGHLARGQRRARPASEELEDLGPRERRRELLTDPGVAGACEVTRHLHQVAESPAAPARAADEVALVHQRGLRDGPPVVDTAEHMRVGNPHTRQERLVEVRNAGDLT